MDPSGAMAMRKILVVDDSAAVRKAIRRILEGLNFEVAEAEDGQKTIDYLREAGLPDAILLDIDMPVMDGLTCLRQLRGDEKLKNAMVLICTAHNIMPKIREALSLGANEYIMKPFTADIIKEKLCQVGLVAT